MGGITMVSLINKPMYDCFMDLISSSTNSIELCAPFIKNDITKSIYLLKKQNTSVRVLTHINFASFYTKACDVDAINTFLNNNGIIKNYPHLHAKFYIFDKNKLIITSANLTASGLKRNFEYGMYTDDAELVDAASRDFQLCFNNELSGTVTFGHALQISKMLTALSTEEKTPLPKLQLDYSSHGELLTGNQASVISNSFSGWNKLMFEELTKLDKQIFDTSDFSSMIPYLTKKYPNNRNIEAKIRQQLQMLRDVGLIQFESRGKYKKLWK
jgi:phosphatidylserine/phosphatidylglycerophosphate/cardiolipin synthase-like enzyme